MSARYAFLILGLLCVACCSPEMMGGMCPAGMVACAENCVPAQSACGSPDAGVGDPDASVGDASVSGLSVSGGTLSPAFSPATTLYAVQVPLLVNAVQVTATAAEGSATILINGMQVASGTASAPITVGAGPTMIAVVVQAQGGAQKSYELVVMRSPINYLKASNTGAGDWFGTPLSLSGDTLAVGASREASSAKGINGNQDDNSADQSGAVYVFTRTGTTWTQQAYLKASNTETFDYFGHSVSLSGDTLVVGADAEDSNAKGYNGNQLDNSATNSGAVYVFTRTGTTWTQQAYLKASNTEGFDGFGWSVSLSGDLLAVGAVYEDSNAVGVNGNQANSNASNSGAAYVFTRTGTTWTQQAYLKASNTGADDGFAWNVALSGDTLAVGAYEEDSNATGINGNQNNDSAARSGAVYVFR